AASGGDGYGAAFVEFRDTQSGVGIVASMLAYGTIPPDDYVGGADLATNKYNAFTSIGPNPLFGAAISGQFVPCAGNGTCATQFGMPFDFRVTKADFQKIIGIARGTFPGMSTNPSDYQVVNFGFRNGIRGNAEVGATILGPTLSVYGS